MSEGGGVLFLNLAVILTYFSRWSLCIYCTSKQNSGGIDIFKLVYLYSTDLF